MKPAFCKRLVSMVLVVLMVAAALLAYGEAPEMKRSASVASEAIVYHSDDEPAVTDELKAWVLRQQGLTGEEAFLDDGYFLQFYAEYMSAMGAMGGGMPVEDYSVYAAGGVAADEGSAGAGSFEDGASRPEAFFVDEESEAVWRAGGAAEDEGFAGVGKSEETLEEALFEEALFEGEAPLYEVIWYQGSDDGWDFYANAEDGEDILLPNDEEPLNEENLFEENLFSLYAEEEEEQPEGQASLSLRMVPAASAFLHTGGLIEPVFQIVDEGNGNIVASLRDNNDEWTWYGDLQASEVGEYTALVGNRDTELSVQWQIEPNMFGAAASALSPLVPLAGKEGELRQQIMAQQGALASQNFGSRLGDLKYTANNVNETWIPSGGEEHAIKVNTWVPFNTFITTAYQSDGMSVSGSLMSYYIGGVIDNNHYTYNGFGYGQSHGSSLWKFEVGVPFAPQPVEIRYASNERIIYGQGLPDMRAFHNIANNPLITKDMPQRAFTDLIAKGLWSDTIEGAFSVNWVNPGWRVGEPNANLDVGSHGPVISLTNNRLHYYVAVNDKDNRGDLAPGAGGTLHVDPCKVTYGWNLPAGAVYTGNAYTQSIDLRATPEHAAALGLGARNLPFNHGNRDLEARVDVYQDGALAYTLDTVLGDVLHLAFTDIGTYQIEVAIGNDNYDLVKPAETFAIAPLIITARNITKPVYEQGDRDIPDSYGKLADVYPWGNRDGELRRGEDYEMTLTRDGVRIAPEQIGAVGRYEVTITPLGGNQMHPDADSHFTFMIVPRGGGDNGGGGGGNNGGGGGNNGAGSGNNGGGGGGILGAGDRGRLLDELAKSPLYPRSFLPIGPIGIAQARADELGDDMPWLTYHEERRAGWTVFEDLNIIAYISDEGGAYAVQKAIDVGPYLAYQRNFAADTLVVVPAEDGNVMMAAVWSGELGTTTQDMLLIDTVAMELVTMLGTSGTSRFDLSLSGMFTSFLRQDVLTTIDIEPALVMQGAQPNAIVAYMLDGHLLEYVSGADATLFNTATFERYTERFHWGSYPLAQATNGEVLVRITDGSDQGDHHLRADLSNPRIVLQERYLLTPKEEKVDFYRWLRVQPRDGASAMRAARSAN
ncbi:MAG: hypothetical protein FWE77_00565 [Clostridia bacterium]|nr:hypothetical protein [Clostridia bacterium]